MCNETPNHLENILTFISNLKLDFGTGAATTPPARWSSWYLALARMTMHPLKMHSNSNFFVFFSAFNAIYSTQLLGRKMEADYVVSPIIIYLFILVVFKFFSCKNGSHKIRPRQILYFFTDTVC